METAFYEELSKLSTAMNINNIMGDNRYIDMVNHQQSFLAGYMYCARQCGYSKEAYQFEKDYLDVVLKRL